MIDNCVPEKRTVAMTAYLTPEEAEKVKKYATDAGYKSTSALIRDALSMIGYGRIRVTVPVQDVQEISRELNIFNIQLYRLIHAFLNNDEIEVEDIDKLYRKTDELCAIVKKIYDVILTERHAQRIKAEKYLKERIRQILDATKGI